MTNDGDEVFPGDWPVDEQAWAAKLAASGVELASLRTELEGIVIEPFYRGGAGLSFPRAPELGWTIAQDYPWPEGGVERLQEALALDARFALARARVRLPASVRPEAFVQLARHVEGIPERPHLCFEAGLGAEELASRRVAHRPGSWSIAIDPIGLALERGDTEVLVDALTHLDRWPALTWMTSGVILHDAGATAAHELGAVIASALAYARLPPSIPERDAAFLRRGTLRLAVGTDLFLDVAKLRAARWLAHAVARKLGTEPDTVSIAAKSSGRFRTAAAVELNLVRGMNEAWSAILGGADEIAIAPYDDVLGSSDAGRRWALTTQLILRDESQLGAVADPLGGSGYVEALTHALARAAWAFVRAIEAEGGMLEVVRSGWLRATLAADAAALREAFARGQHPLVGVTVFPEPAPDSSPDSISAADRGERAGLSPLRLEPLGGPA